MFDFLKQVPVPVYAMAAVTVFGVCALLATPGPNDLAVASSEMEIESAAVGNAEQGASIETTEPSEFEATAIDAQDETMAGDETELQQVSADDSPAVVAVESEVEESEKVTVPLVQVANNQVESADHSGQSVALNDPNANEPNQQPVAYSEAYPDPSERIASVLKDAVSGFVFGKAENNISSGDENHTSHSEDSNAPETLAPAADHVFETYDDEEAPSSLDESSATDTEAKTSIDEVAIKGDPAPEPAPADDSETEAALIEGSLTADAKPDAAEDDLAADRPDAIDEDQPTQEATITITNSQSSGLPVSFLLNSTVVKLAAGESKTLPAGDGVTAKYSRGGQFGVHEMILAEGSWNFTVSRENGWQLSREQ